MLASIQYARADAQREEITAADWDLVIVDEAHHARRRSEDGANLAYNLLCGGRTLEDLEQRRQDEVYLDALGAQVIPDPTTAGDFCRRFTEADIEVLLAAIDRVRVKVRGYNRRPGGSVPYRGSSVHVP